MPLTYLLAVVLPAIARNWEMTYCDKSQAGEPPAQTIELSGSQLGTCGGPTDWTWDLCLDGGYSKLFLGPVFSVLGPSLESFKDTWVCLDNLPT